MMHELCPQGQCRPVEERGDRETRTTPFRPNPKAHGFAPHAALAAGSSDAGPRRRAGPRWRFSTREGPRNEQPRPTRLSDGAARPSTPGALLAYAKLPTFTRLIGYPSGLHKFAERMLELDKGTTCI